jgi:hypothetical protein
MRSYIYEVNRKGVVARVQTETERLREMRGEREAGGWTVCKGSYKASNKSDKHGGVSLLTHQNTAPAATQQPQPLSNHTAVTQGHRETRHTHSCH